MSDERTRRGNDTPRRVQVSEPATAHSAERFFQNSFFVVVAAIGAVLVLVVFAMLFAALLTQNVDTDTLSAMLGTGTTVIGTLVGSFVGLRQGQQGRDQAQQRAEQSRRETERVLWFALAYVPSDKAEEILRSAPNSDVRPT
jgi:ABC-type transport system involved in cytochrome bd biosynthesis fused ATPase/permease subunit